jgi:hypothetical protein
MKKLIWFALYAVVFLFTGNVARVSAQPCMIISQHPTFTYESQCDTSGCIEACTNCRIVYVQNLTSCCVQVVNIRKIGSDTCYSVCGEIVKPTRSTWGSTTPGCDPNTKTVNNSFPGDELCQGDILAFKICTSSFPMSITVDWVCNGVSCIGHYVVN